MTFISGSHFFFFQRAPSLLRVVLLKKEKKERSHSIQVEPVLFFLFPLCVISLQDRRKKATPQQHEDGESRQKQNQLLGGGNMKAVLDICLIFLMLHTPDVLSLSTRKLHTDVHRCMRQVLVVAGHRVLVLVHAAFFGCTDQFKPCVTQRSDCKQLRVTVFCSGIHDFKDNTAGKNGFTQQYTGISQTSDKLQALLIIL